MIKIKKSRIEKEIGIIHEKMKIAMVVGILSTVFMVTVSIGCIIPAIVAFKFYKNYDNQIIILSKGFSGEVKRKMDYKKNRAYGTFSGEFQGEEFSRNLDEGINRELIKQQEEMNRQLYNHHEEQVNREFMEFSQKSVTPFDEGGFVQGTGFNLSDTMMSNMNCGF